MKKKILTAAIALSAFGFQANALDLRSIIGNAGTAVSGVVEGLFTQTDITVDQMAGTWTVTGSAVCFQSDNFLQKAGGSAAASTIESKLDPYYKQYGLTGSTMTIQSDGSFVLKVKGISLKGTIQKREDGNFDFNFTPFGNFKLGSVKAYVEKPVGGLNIMFDASKLKSLLSTIAGFTGNSLAKTAGSVLDSYDGLCVGFAFSGSGSNSSSPSDGTGSDGNKNIDLKGIGDSLKGLFGK